jgi:hypothetical protein
VHEFFLCKQSFEQFTHLAKLQIVGHRDKSIKISCHDAYANFLHHLFEFHVGCLKRDLRDTRDIASETLDKVFNNEVRKALKARTEAIEQGIAPAWENHISTYQVDVPPEFGTQFRRIRNRTAHAGTKRSVPGTDLSLAKFYELYHLFVYLLYYSGQWLWTVKDIEAHDWKAIEEFDLAVRTDPPQPETT